MNKEQAIFNRIEKVKKLNTKKVKAEGNRILWKLYRKLCECREFNI